MKVQSITLVGTPAEIERARNRLDAQDVQPVEYSYVHAEDGHGHIALEVEPVSGHHIDPVLLGMIGGWVRQLGT